MGTKSIGHTHRRPLAFTKCPWLERAPSRGRCPWGRSSSPRASQGFLVHAHDQRPAFGHESPHQQPQEYPAGLPPGPHIARLSTRWYRWKHLSSPRPAALRAEQTVLLAGARTAPASSTRTCGQTRLENSGANGFKRCSILVGRVCIVASPGRLATSIPYLLPLSKWLKSS